MQKASSVLFAAFLLGACGSDPDEPLVDSLAADIADIGVDGEQTSPCPDWRCAFPMVCDELIQMPGSTVMGEGVEDGYYLAHPTYRHWVRRDVAMLLSYAACEVRFKFPEVAPLGVGDQSEEDGSIPGTSIGKPGHPTGTHTMGHDTDVAYYQTDELNELQIVCGDGSDTNYNGQPGKYNDGYFCTTKENIVNWEHQVWFFAKLFESDQPRVFGIDQEMVEDLGKELERQYKAGDISEAIMKKFNTKLAWGAAGGWAFHHHHIHLSFK